MKSLRKKTTATLLTAIFMISMFAAAITVSAADELKIELGAEGGATAEWTANKHSGSYAAHLVTGSVTAGDEARIEITMPAGFTLGDLQTLSWDIYSVSGYPAHVDITLDTPGPLQSMLTAELAVNNPSYTHPPSGPYGGWLETFEMAKNDGFDVIDDDTVFWVTKMGAGDQDAPSSTLASWKANTVDKDPFNELPSGTAINSDTVVFKMEIEVDNWIVPTEVYIDDLELNGGVYDLESSGTCITGYARPPVISISVTPSNIDFGELVLGKYYDVADITVENTGEVDVDLSASLVVDDGFYASSLYLDDFAVSSWGKTLAETASKVVDLELDIPRNAAKGTHDAVLVFWAEEAP